MTTVGAVLLEYAYCFPCVGVRIVVFLFLLLWSEPPAWASALVSAILLSSGSPGRQSRTRCPGYPQAMQPPDGRLASRAACHFFQEAATLRIELQSRASWEPRGSGTTPASSPG